METGARTFRVSLFRFDRGAVDTDARRHQAAVGRGHSGPVHPNDPVRPDDNRASRLYRPVACAKGIGNSIQERELAKAIGRIGRIRPISPIRPIFMIHEKAAEAAAFIQSKYPKPIKTAVVLGSGLGAFADELENAVTIPYKDIPNFATATVVGHAGQLVLGEIDGLPIVVQKGRFHFYEGYAMEQVTFPVRTFGLMGVENLILTNAAGSLSTEMTPGSLMLISDHLNCIGVNPLRGSNDDRFGPRFPDMTAVYDRDFQEIISTAADEISNERVEAGVDRRKKDFLHRGVYCGL